MVSAVHKNFVPGKKSFYGKTSFCAGSGISGRKRDRIRKQDARIITDQMTLCQIGLVLHHHGRDVFYPLLPEGKPWFEAKGEIEIFVSGITKIIFEFRSKEGRKMASVCMPLTGLKKSRDIVYKLKMRGEYLSPGRCKIKVTDEGFGSIRPSSYQVWQQVIRLERGNLMSKIVLCETQEASYPYRIEKIHRSFPAMKSYAIFWISI